MLVFRYIAAVITDIIARLSHGLGIRRSRFKQRASMIKLRPLLLSK